jgi:pimeloyl-ACP methyl ester carboxylesterase
MGILVREGRIHAVGPVNELGREEEEMDMRRTTSDVIFVLAAFVCGATSGSAATPNQAKPATKLFSVEVSGKGPPMILIPGGMSSGDVWKGTVAHYADRYECHVLTLAGFAGQPPSDVTPFLPGVRDAIATYIREHRLERPVVVGHSLGGFLALSLATEHPDLVGTLVIVEGVPAPGATGNPDVSAEERKAMGLRLADFYAKTGEAERRRMIATMAESPAHVDLITWWGMASDPATVRKALTEIVMGDVRADLAKIETPALVLASPAGDGTTTGREGVERLFRLQFAKMKAWQLEVAPRARHFIMYDDSAWMFEKMDTFLGR